MVRVAHGAEIYSRRFGERITVEYEAQYDAIIIAADGTGQRLSLPSYFFDWSPDASQLVYFGTGPSIPGARDNRSTAIDLIDADGTDQRWLADGDYPVWSP